MIEILSPLQNQHMPSNMFLDNHNHHINPLIIPERIPEDSDSTSASSSDNNMGITMIDNTINEFGKRPLHTNAMSNKRVKVFSCFPSAETSFASSCYECKDVNQEQEEAQHTVHQQDQMIFRP